MSESNDPRSEDDYIATRNAIRDSVRAWWRFITDKHSNESFYAFACCMTDDFVGPVCTANTTENLAVQSAKTSYSEECGWNPAHWYWREDGDPGGDLSDAWDQLSKEEEASEWVTDTTLRHRARLLGATIDALTDLRNDDLWEFSDTGLFVFCLMWDGFESDWLMSESARRINPPGMLRAHPLDCWSECFDSNAHEVERLPELAQTFHSMFGPPSSRDVAGAGLKTSAERREAMIKLAKQSRPPGDGPPCPECGERLRTPQARQCFNCGANWH